jgi:hypothetical protein
VTFDHRERDYQREGENKISNREKKKKMVERAVRERESGKEEVWMKLKESEAYNNRKRETRVMPHF